MNKPTKNCARCLGFPFRVRLLLVILIASIVSLPTMAQRKKCLKCGGSGKIYFYDSNHKTSGFGLSPIYKNCPTCGQVVNINGGASHWHPCPRCENGYIPDKSSNTSASSKSSSSSSDGNWNGLFPHEEEQMKELIKLQMYGKTVLEQCSVCKGKGKVPCMLCGGTGVFWGRECTKCLGIIPWDYCSSCNLGVISKKVPLTQEENKNAQDQINELLNLGQSRLYGTSYSYSNSSASTSQSTTAPTQTTPSSYSVTINAYSSSDEIYVNGKYCTRGSYTGQFEPGNHTIECRNTGKYSTSKSIYVNESMTVSIPELKQMPVLEISTDNSISLYIDDKYIGTGTRTTYVDFGTHKVEFKKTNHRTVTKTINVNSISGNTITVSSLEPICGSLKITSTPSGMNVKLDGEGVGTTPLNLSRIIIGKHNIELSQTHFYTEKKDVEVTEGNLSGIDFKMTEYATIEFSSNAVETVIYIDGKRIGDAPVSTDVLAGRHTFRAEGWHHRPMERTVNVTGSTPNQYFRLTRQYQRVNVFYIQPTFQCVSMNAIGGTMGFYAGVVNLEGTYLYGLKRSEDIYWRMEDPNDSSSPLKYTYKPWFVGGKVGGGIIAGTRLRFTPQVGIGCNFLKGRGDYGKSESYALVGSGGLRFECALAPCLNLVVAPEYTFPLKESENYKAIAEVSSAVNNWSKGFNCRVGLALFW